MGVKVRKRKETYLYLAVGLLILLISSSLAVAAFGGEFEDAVAAYERGDYATAYRLFKPMAEQGHAEAQYNLGGMYAEGRGVPQDYGKAVKWFRKAAEQGHAEAQYNLGGMYFGGRGVPQDFVLAHMWFNLSISRVPASEGETREATEIIIDLVASKMTPFQIAEAQRLAREWKPKKEVK
jgi:tetratricopeptide (TPR) repeat protein